MPVVLVRLLASLVLVTDVAPTNLIFRSWLFEISWQFGYGGCKWSIIIIAPSHHYSLYVVALYLVGIAQTLADVSNLPWFFLLFFLTHLA